MADVARDGGKFGSRRGIRTVAATTARKAVHMVLFLELAGLALSTVASVIRIWRARCA